MKFGMRYEESEEQQTFANNIGNEKKILRNNLVFLREYRKIMATMKQ